MRIAFEQTGDPTADRNFQALAGFLDELGVYWGLGSPEGVVAAGPGAVYRRLDGAAGTSIYIKEAGPATSKTGWVAK